MKLLLQTDRSKKIESDIPSKMEGGERKFSHYDCRATIETRYRSEEKKGGKRRIGAECNLSHLDPVNCNPSCPIIVD